MNSSAQNKLINYIYQLLNNSLQFLSKSLSIHPNTQDQDDLMHLLLWLEFLHILESKSYLNQNPHYLCEMFHKIKSESQLKDQFPSFGFFLKYLFEKMLTSTPQSTDMPFVEDNILGRILIIGTSVLEIAWDQQWSLYSPEKIPDHLFYASPKENFRFPNSLESINLRTMGNLPDDLPILNILEVQKPFEGEITEFVFGALFEKFLTLSHKKSTGSYYTPQKISMFIVEEVIRASFKAQYCLSIEKLPEQIDSKIIMRVWQSLQKIRILDPSLGTGHFLISACHFLVKTYEIIWELVQKNPGMLGSSLDLYEFQDLKSISKKSLDIFTISDRSLFRYIVKVFFLLPHTLYGIDLNANAVVMAKLRFLLDLIIDLPPNTPYLGLISQLQMNIKCGNSLIGFIQTPPDLLKKPLKTPACLSSNFFGQIQQLFNVARLNPKISSLPFEILLQLKQNLLQNMPLVVSMKDRQAIVQCIKEISIVLGTESQRFFQESESNSKNSIPFHWGVEFPELFSDLANQTNQGFTFVVGNPPYGNILTSDEKRLCHTYATFTNEIAAVFIERIIDLQRPSGSFGLIVSYAVTFSKDISKTREKIAQNYSQCKIATFDRDKCRFFEGVTQSVSILFCSQKIVEESTKTRVEIPKCELMTTQMFRSMPDLHDLPFQVANPFLLGEKMGALLSAPHRIPKLGYAESSAILRKMAQYSITLNEFTHPWKIFGDSLPKKADENSIYVRISGNYWYNAWDRAPYSGTQIASLSFQPEHHSYRNFCLLLLNSSLYYWWFRIFSDGRHMNADIMNAFPIPSNFAEKWSKWQNLISHFLPILMQVMFTNFDADHNRFLSSKFKGTLDLCDLILADFYALSERETAFILNYETEIRGGNQLNPTLGKIISEFRTNPSDALITTFLDLLS